MQPSEALIPLMNSISLGGLFLDILIKILSSFRSGASLVLLYIVLNFKRLMGKVNTIDKKKFLSAEISADSS